MPVTLENERRIGARARSQAEWDAEGWVENRLTTCFEGGSSAATAATEVEYLGLILHVFGAAGWTRDGRVYRYY